MIFEVSFREEIITMTTNNFNMNIMKAIDNNVDSFIKCLSIKYKIPAEQLHDIWISGGDDTAIETPEPHESTPVVDMDVEVVSPQVLCKEVKKRPTKADVINKCPYLFARGPNKGHVCNGDIRQSGREFCPKHTSKQPTVVKERKTQLIPETTDIKTTTKVLRKNKTIDDRLWHAETGMVFDSSSHRTVIGRLVDNEILKLTPDDIVICKDIGFAFTEPEDELMPPVEEAVVKPPAEDEDEDDTIKQVEKLLTNMSVNDSSEFDMVSDSEEELEEEDEE
jgi:hypothetical protein